MIHNFRTLGIKMATQGLLSATKNGKLLFKIITGSDGYNVPKLAQWLKENPSAQMDDVWKQAATLFAKDSLVLQLSPTEVICDNEWAKPNLDSECLYRTTFENPSFNPRWESGIAEYCETVELSN